MNEETVWLDRQQLADLFDRDVKTISKHINNAQREELKGMATVAKFAIVQNEGGRMVNRTKEFYNFCNYSYLCTLKREGYYQIKRQKNSHGNRGSNTSA